jgi:hypothetical protein
MQHRPEILSRRLIRAGVAGATALLAAVVLTWPLATGMSRFARTTSADGMYAVWNVAWVARTVVEEPARLFHANIFHPERYALAFSELNLVAGLVALPFWLLTSDPYVAHNAALLFAFSTSALGAWLLARRLSGSSAAAVVAGVMFGFCPYFFAHTAHIQLLMGGGIPLSLLMLHRVADAPSLARGVSLGVALAVQALACAYYGILAGLMIGYAAIFFAISRSLWRDRTYLLAIALGAGVSVLLVIPFFLPFLEVQAGGFHRTLEESRTYAANLPSYLASPAHAHQGLLRVAAGIGEWNEVLFPGGLALVLGLAGALLVWRVPRGEGPLPGQPARGRETVLLYGSMGLLIVWASLGPAAGLYSALFHAVPLFSFLRAPSRFGLVVPLILGLFASMALARLPLRRQSGVSIAVAALAALEIHSVPFRWDPVPQTPSAYRYLAQLPRGPVVEFPFYGQRPAFHLHAQYMLFSTAHWQPLINGYSDHIPQTFRDDAPVLESFPSNDSFAVLRRRRASYITVNWEMYGPRRQEIADRLQPFRQHLRELAGDERMTLYEVVSFP